MTTSKKKGGKKQQRRVHQETQNIVSYNGLIHLLDDLEVSFSELGIIHNELIVERDDEYQQLLISYFLELKRPIIHFLWILHPFKMKKYLINCGNENTIFTAMNDIATFDLHNPLIQFNLDNENYLYKDLKLYKSEYTKYLKEVELKTNDGFADILEVRNNLLKQLVSIVNSPLDKIIEEFKISNVNTMLYYILALHNFKDEILENLTRQEKYLKAFYRIEDYALQKRMKRVIEVLDKIFKKE